MERSFSESYKQAGVDITAGYKAVELMKKHIARTVTAGAASDIVEDATAPPTAQVRRTRGRGTESRLPFSSFCEPKGTMPPPDRMGPADGASPAPSGVGGTPLSGHALIVRALFSRASGASRGYGRRGWKPRGRCRGEAPSRGRA